MTRRIGPSGGKIEKFNDSREAEDQETRQGFWGKPLVRNVMLLLTPPFSVFDTQRINHQPVADADSGSCWARSNLHQILQLARS